MQTGSWVTPRLSVSERIVVDCRCYAAAQRGQSSLTLSARHVPIGLLCFPSSRRSLSLQGLVGIWLLVSFINNSWKRGRCATNMLCHSLWPLANIQQEKGSSACVSLRRCDSNAHVISISKSGHILETNRLLPTLRILDNFCRSGCVGYKRQTHHSQMLSSPPKSNNVINPDQRFQKCFHVWRNVSRTLDWGHFSCLTGLKTCQGLSEDT